jgi:hypothetical protein
MIKQSLITPAICAGALVSGALLAFDLNGPTCSVESIASELVDRAQYFVSGAVHFRHFRFSATSDQIAALGALIVESQDQPQQSLVGAATDWVETLPAGFHEGWEGTICFDPNDWCQRRTRLQDFDTTEEHIVAAAAASGSLPAPIMTEEWVHRLGNEVERVVDGMTVFLRSDEAQSAPLRSIDCSLVSWQDAIVQGAAPGQTITAWQAGNLHRIKYHDILDDGTEFETTYEFNSARDWAPTSVLSTRNGAVVRETLYGFETDGPQPARPSVILRADWSDSGTIRASLIVVDVWTDTVDPHELKLKLPPMRYQIEEGVGTETVGEWIVPQFMQGLGPGQSLPTGIAAIFDTWGTDNPDTDFNADSTVNAADVVFLAEALESSL